MDFLSIVAMECAFELMHSIAVAVQPLITDTLAKV